MKPLEKQKTDSRRGEQPSATRARAVDLYPPGRGARPHFTEEEKFDLLRGELAEIKELLATPAPRPDDLVGASYIAARTGLAERTVLEGKAGTSAIPRVELKSVGAKRPLIRFQRAAADRWIRELAAKAVAKEPRQRALRLINRKSRSSAA
jgi:hypothetical protein